jgi:hypothetical protein
MFSYKRVRLCSSSASQCRFWCSAWHTKKLPTFSLTSVSLWMTEIKFFLQKTVWNCIISFFSLTIWWQYELHRTSGWILCNILQYQATFSLQRQAWHFMVKWDDYLVVRWQSTVIMVGHLCKCIHWDYYLQGTKNLGIIRRTCRNIHANGMS